MQLSEQQQAVLDWAKNDQGSLILQARAGCGKTSTLIELVKMLAKIPGTEGFLGAFNKSIATELNNRLQAAGIPFRTFNASTMHAAGFAAYKRIQSKVVVDARKVANIINTMQEEAGENSEQADYLQAVFMPLSRLVSYAKQDGFGVLVEGSAEDWMQIVDHYSIEDALPADLNGEGGISRLVETARDVLSRSNSIRDSIDFDDMLLFPLLYDAKFWPKTWVLLDEAQDTNAVRREIALRMLKPGTGRLVAVGDACQAIYGFAGASADSLDLIRKATNAKTLPLNITYRCAQAVVAEAQLLVPDITAHKQNEAGVVRSVSMEPAENEPGFWDESLTKQDAILCRKTAPVVSLAFQLIRRGTGCRVEGRDIGQNLLTLAGRWKVKSLNALRTKLQAHLESESEKLRNLNKKGKLSALEDKVETLTILIERTEAEGGHTVDDLKRTVEALFGDSALDQKQALLTLSTVHKAKGREWERVYILGKNQYMPSKWTKQEWEVEQEQNLIYVAQTRAKRELVYVDVPQS